MAIGNIFQQISDWIQKDKITNFQFDRSYFVLLNSPFFRKFAQQQLNNNVLTQLETILKAAPIKVLNTKVSITKTNAYSGTMKFIMTYKQENQIKEVHLQPWPEDYDVPTLAWYFGFAGVVNY